MGWNSWGERRGMKGWCVRKSNSCPNQLALAAKVNLVYRFLLRYDCKIALG